MNITLSQKALDGLIEAGNRNDTTAEAIATELLTNAGNQYADLFKIGIITSAAFVMRFKPDEYAAILASAPDHTEVSGYVTDLVNNAYVSLTDPRLEPALQTLAAAELIAPERVAEILFYQRPVAPGK
jgi:hypothetical protein